MTPILLLLSGLFVPLQTELPAPAPWSPEHAEREVARREALFFEAWDRAPGARWLEFARAELERSRGAGEPRTLNPSTAAISDSLRVLLRPDDPAGELRDEQRFVDSLCLVLVPGVVPGAPGGETTPVTVFVHPLYGVGRSAPSEAFDLVLTWRGPQGATEHARREPVLPNAVPGGFEMYIRSPKGEPGTWWLVPSVEMASGESYEGHPVRFEVVPVLDELRTALQAEVSSDELEGLEAERARRSLRELKDLRERGLPPRSLEALMRGLGLSPQPAERTSFERVRRAGLVGGGLRLEGADFGAPTDRGDVLILLSSEERSGAALGGEALETWAGLARRGWNIVEFPSPLAESGDGGLSLLETLQEREGRDARPLWIVARGDAAGRLLIGVYGETELGRAFRAEVDGLVLESAAPAARWGRPRKVTPPRWPAGPCAGFVLTAGAGEDGDVSIELPAEGSWIWLRRENPLFLARRELPALLLGLESFAAR